MSGNARNHADHATADQPTAAGEDDHGIIIVLPPDPDAQDGSQAALIAALAALVLEQAVVDVPPPPMRTGSQGRRIDTRARPRYHAEGADTFEEQHTYVHKL